MRRIHKSQITIFAIVLFSLVLILGYQNCGQHMQTLGNQTLNSGSGGEDALPPLGVHLIYSTESTQQRSVLGYDADARSTLPPFLVPAGFNQTIQKIESVGDLGSSSSAEPDGVEDYVLLTFRNEYVSASQTYNFSQAKLVLVSGKENVEMRSYDMPSMNLNSSQYPYTFFIIDSPNNNYKNILLIRSRFNDSGVVDNRTYFRVLSTEDFSVTVNERLVANSDAVTVNYYSEANLVGTSDKEYVFFQTNSSGRIMKLILVDSQTLNLQEINVASLETNTLIPVMDINSDGYQEILVYTTYGEIEPKVYSLSDLSAPIASKNLGSVSNPFIRIERFNNKNYLKVMTSYQPGANFDLRYYEMSYYSLDDDEIIVFDQSILGLPAQKYLSGIQFLPDLNGDGVSEILGTISRQDIATLQIVELAVFNGVQTDQEFLKLYSVDVSNVMDSSNFSLRYRYDPFRVLIDKTLNDIHKAAYQGDE